MKVHSVLTIMDKPSRKQTALARSVALQKTIDVPLEVVSFCWESMDELRELTDAKERRAIKQGLIAERQAWQRDAVASVAKRDADISYRTVWTEDIAGWTHEHIAEHGHDLIVKSVNYSKTLLHTPLDWQLLREVEQHALISELEQTSPQEAQPDQ